MQVMVPSSSPFLRRNAHLRPSTLSSKSVVRHFSGAAARSLHLISSFANLAPTLVSILSVKVNLPSPDCGQPSLEGAHRQLGWKGTLAVGPPSVPVCHFDQFREYPSTRLKRLSAESQNILSHVSRAHCSSDLLQCSAISSMQIGSRGHATCLLVQ